MSATLFIGGLLLMLCVVPYARAWPPRGDIGQMFMIAIAASFGCFIMLLSVIQS